MTVSELIAYAESELAFLESARRYNLDENPDWDMQEALYKIALTYLRTMAPIQVPGNA